MSTFKMISTFVVALSLQFLAVNAKFSWTNCSPADSTIKIQNVNIGPDPIVVPGNLDISISGNSTAPLGSSAIHLSIKRKTFLVDIPIPCLNNIGSCTYLDSCTLVDQMKRENWMGITTGVATEVDTMLAKSGVDASQCPQPPRSLSIEHQTIHLPEIPAALSHFAAGDYHLRMTVVDNTSGKVLICVDANFTMKEKEPCTGILCIFG